MPLECFAIDVWPQLFLHVSICYYIYDRVSLKSYPVNSFVVSATAAAIDHKQLCDVRRARGRKLIKYGEFGVRA